jgi:hypothetical protein
MQGGRERRKLRRHRAHVPVEFRSAALRGAGEITNISKAGLFIRARLLPLPGDELAITIRPASPASFVVRGAVRWNTDQLPESERVSPGFGVLVPESDPRFLAFFEEMLTT